MQWLVARIAATRFVRQALADNADLSAFKGKPSLKVILGVTAIIISYIIGWPAVALLGFLAAYYGRPAIVVVGGPLIYGLSHLVFLLGMYLAGAQYSWIFLRWLTRVTMLKLLKRYPAAAPPVE
ncbi:MAG: hypothetical protein HY911_16105 [Desulfobacterales bacterium]|nr:hypothetical protein [Desulfobacterales bacterium]